MNDTSTSTSIDLLPQLLYRVDGNQARFATWRLAEGHETLALFTTAALAEEYRQQLTDSASWTTIQPEREKLVEILQASRAAGILYAVLDPLGGNARTLFDIPRVLAGK